MLNKDIILKVESQIREEGNEGMDKESGTLER